MPGEIGIIVTFLTKVFDFAVDADGYTKLSRDQKLNWIGRGLNEAIARNDWAAVDAFYDELRQLRLETGV